MAKQIRITRQKGQPDIVTVADTRQEQPKPVRQPMPKLPKVRISNSITRGLR